MNVELALQFVCFFSVFKVVVLRSSFSMQFAKHWLTDVELCGA